jgi:hypothetical protein
MPVGRDNVITAGTWTWNEKVVLHPGKRHPIDHVLSKVHSIWIEQPHHAEDCHNGTTAVGMAPSFCSLRHTRPNNRKGQVIHKGPIPQKHAKVFTPANPRH